MSGAPSPVRWGLVGLGWVAAECVAPAMVKSAGSRLAACLGSSLAKGQAFAERFGVERVHSDLEVLMHDRGALPGEPGLRTGSACLCGRVARRAQPATGR